MAEFILDKELLYARLNKLKEHCDAVSYSAKTNYELIEPLQNEEVMFSVHTLWALDKIPDKKRVNYFLQATTYEDLEQCYEKGVRNFVVDNEEDHRTVMKLADQYSDMTVYLRMRLKEHTISTGKYFVYGFFSEEVNKLVTQTKKKAKVGIHFHRKSQNVSEWRLKYELQQLLSEETLASIEAVNIGGGLPVKYRNFEADVHERILKEIDELRSWLKGSEIRLIIEPGRYLAAPCIELHTKIVLRYGNNLVVDCSVYNSAMDAFVTGIKLRVKGELEKGNAYTIKGCTPDSMDIFRYRVYLDDPQPGDTLIFENAGAYNYATDFCGLQKLETKTK